MALSAATIVVGLAVHSLAGGGALGAPSPPFLMHWAPSLPWPALIIVLLAMGLAWLAPRLSAQARDGLQFSVFVYAIAGGMGLGANAIRGGTSAWTHVFVLGPHGSAEAAHEYLPALPQLNRGVGHYVGHFAQLLPALPTHAQGNPPGPLVAMHLLGVTTPARLAAACVAIGALTSPFAYALGTALGDERRGRAAALLTAFSPAVVLFGVTSLDYVFAALAIAIASLLVVSATPLRVLGCVLAAVGSFFSWVLLAIPVWAVIVVLVREGGRRALLLAAGLATAIVLFNLGLVLFLGYRPFAVLQALGPIYAHGIAAHRPYLYWLFGSPVAWLVMLGLPTAWLALRSLAAREPAAIALAVVVVVASVAGLTKAETERIWLPFVPLAAVSAAAALPLTRWRAVLVTLAVQGLVVELLFNTVW